jgi:hypothetical protein
MCENAKNVLFLSKMRKNASFCDFYATVPVTRSVFFVKNENIFIKKIYFLFFIKFHHAKKCDFACR